MLRDWAWELEEGGHGPDHCLIANFAPSDSKKLAQLVCQHPLPGFVLDQELNTHKLNQCTIYNVYVDQTTYAQLMANRESGQHKNIWIYSQIEVCDHQLIIERSFGVRGRQNEIELIEMLLQSPEVKLVDWKVIGGGQGYSETQVATGVTAEELMNYLKAKPLPDFQVSWIH